MMTQVINILIPFLAFAFAYNPTKVHKMMVIMPDPHFKNMKIIWDFLGNWFVVQIVAKYNTDMLYPILLQVFLDLNPIKALAKLKVVEDDDFFWAGYVKWWCYYLHIQKCMGDHVVVDPWSQRMWLNVWHQKPVWLNSTRKCWNNMICIQSWYNLSSWFIFLILNYVQHFFCFFPFFFQKFLCVWFECVLFLVFTGWLKVCGYVGVEC